MHLVLKSLHQLRHLNYEIDHKDLNATTYYRAMWAPRDAMS